MDKFLLPVAGRPLIAPLLEELDQLGFERIVLSASRRGWQQLRSELAKGSIQCPAAKLQFVEERECLGSAAALQQVLEVLPAGLEELLVCYGDLAAAPGTIPRLLEEHRKGKGDLTLLVDSLEKLTFGQPERLGDWICVRVSGGEVEAVLGHPRSYVTHRLGGMFVLGPRALAEVPNTAPYLSAVPVGGMPPEEYELAETAASLLRQGARVRAVEAEGYLVDVDKPWHLLEANHLRLDYLALEANQAGREPPVLSPGVDLQGRLICGKNVVIEPGTKIRGTVWVGDNSILSGAIIDGPTWIGRNCRVEDYCRIYSHTSIGDHSKIGHCAEVGGILMEGTAAVHYLEFFGILGRSTDLGAGTVCGTLRFDDGPTPISVLGRKELPRKFSNGAYLGDFTRTGVNTILMPGVRVGPYSVVGPGVLLDEDVPERTMVLTKQELIKRPWGPEKYGW